MAVCTTMILTLIIFAVVGAILGFLRCNFTPAKIHMDNGGACFLGLLVAELSIVTQ